MADNKLSIKENAEFVVTSMSKRDVPL